MKTSNADVAKYLNAAADHLETHDWVQGVMCANKEGRATTLKDPSTACWCGAGAVYFVAPSWEEALDTVFALTDYMSPGVWPQREGAGSSKAPLPQFNDAEGRTKEEVVALLRKGAAHFASLG